MTVFDHYKSLVKQAKQNPKVNGNILNFELFKDTKQTENDIIVRIGDTSTFFIVTKLSTNIFWYTLISKTFHVWSNI